MPGTVQNAGDTQMDAIRSSFSRYNLLVGKIEAEIQVLFVLGWSCTQNAVVAQRGAVLRGSLFDNYWCT